MIGINHYKLTVCLFCFTGGGGSGNVGSSVYPHLYNIHTTLLQHHNNINSAAVQTNSIDQSVAATLQSTVNTNTTPTDAVVSEHSQVILL